MFKNKGFFLTPSEKKYIYFFAKLLSQNNSRSFLEEGDFVQELTLQLWLVYEKGGLVPKDRLQFSKKILRDKYRDLKRKKIRTEKNDRKIFENITDFFEPTQPVIDSQDLQKAISTLSPKQKQLIFDLQTMSIVEISKKNLEPIRTVSKRLEAIQKKIMKFF